MSELIRHLPAIALRGMTILPDMIVHFDVSREKSIKATEAAMLQDQNIFLIAQRDAEAEEPQQDQLYRIGIIAVIKQIIKLPNNILRVLVEGIERAELSYLETDGEYLKAEVIRFDTEEMEEIPENSREAMIRNLKEIFGQYALENPKIGKELIKQLLEIADLKRLVDQIAINIPLYYEEKQKILEAVNLTARYELDVYKRQRLYR